MPLFQLQWNKGNISKRDIYRIMPHVIFYFKFMDDKIYLIYNFDMKKCIVLTIISIFIFSAMPIFAEENSAELTKVNNIKATKKIDKEVSKSFKKQANKTLPKKNINFLKKKQSTKQEVSTENKVNLSADAMVLYNANDIENALNILNSIPEADRTALDWLLMGNIYQDKKDIDKSALMYQKSILTDKKFYRAYYNLANLYLDEENSTEAIKLYKLSLRYKYDFAYANYNLGCAYVKLGKLKSAKSSFLRAIENKRDMTDAYYNLAFVYKKLNNTKKAEQYLKIYNELILREMWYDKNMEALKGIKKNFSKIVLAIIILSLAYLGAFRQDILKHQYDKALGMYFIYKGDKSLKQQELQNAIDYYRRGLELYPKHYNAWYNLGNIYVLYEDYFAATDAYNKAIELNSKYMLARMNLGIILSEKIGDFDEAIDQYQKIIETQKRGIYIPFILNSEKSIKMNKAIAYYNLGHTYRQKALYLPQTEVLLIRKYLNQSAESYEEALKILGKDYDTSYNLALVYHLMREYNKAGINYCKAIETDYMSFEAHYNLAILLKHLKFYKESLDEMEKATMLVTTSKTPYSHVMYIYAVLNDISTSAFIQASEEMKEGKIFNETMSEKDKKKLSKKDLQRVERLEKLEKEYNEDQTAIGLTHGKIVANEELDEIINRKFKECPVELFSNDSNENN